MLQKSKQKVQGKLGILSSIRDHGKVGKQGRSPTPADVLVDIIYVIPNSVMCID